MVVSELQEDGGSTVTEPSPRILTLVYAAWCPHCNPVSIELAPRLAKQLGARLRILDIDVPAEEAEADRIVRDHGDWSEDYLVPQLFLEGSHRGTTHLLTGVPGSVEGTRRAWEELLRAGKRLLE